VADLIGALEPEIERLRAELATVRVEAIRQCDKVAAERDALLELLKEAFPYVEQDDNGYERKGTIELALIREIRDAIDEARKGEA
jgi:hypothetical protein